MLKRKLIYVCMFLMAGLHFFLPSYGQVNLQTGSAVFSIPMFNWQDDKSRLMAGVTLGYNSGNGLKVSDVASNVGEGWNLVAGGEISRLQEGEPDDQIAQGPANNSLDISRYPNGYLYANTPAVNGCPSELASYPIYRARNQLYTQNNDMNEDKQLDYFSFQFNGKSGMFVLDKVNGVGASLGDTKMKITFHTNPTAMQALGIRTTIDWFKIQDVDGLIYIFSNLSVARVLHADFCGENLAAPVAQPNFAAIHIYHQASFENSKLVRPNVVMGWSLTEIDDPLTGRKVTFNYTVRNIVNSAGADISYNQEGQYVIISHKTSKTQTPELTSIVYPDGHVVALTYGAARMDLNGDYVLSAVDITYNGRPLAEYQLKTSYFIKNRYGTPSTSQQISQARLCLRSVTKIGPDLKEDSPPYIFDYYLGSDAADDFVPPPFCPAKDIWGYYNGDQSIADDNSTGPYLLYNAPSVSQLTYHQLVGACFMNVTAPGQVYLNPKANYAKNGLLKQVIYPTGGTLSYSYGQNTGILKPTGSADVVVGGVHVVSTGSTDGGHSNGCGNPMTTNYSYTTSGNGSSSSLWGLEMPVNVSVMSSHYQSEDKRFHLTWSNPTGECYWNYAYPGILSATEAIDLPGMLKFLEAAGPALGIIGAVMDVIDVLNLVFVSTGVLAWVAVIVDFVGAVLSIALTCFGGDNAKDNISTVHYSADLNAGNPLPAQFKRVEVTESPGTNGKTAHVFTSEDDYPVKVPAGTNTDFSARQRYAPWVYGLPETTTVYDANGNTVKYFYNQYDFYGVIDPNCDSHDPLNPCPQKAWHDLSLTSTKCTITHMTSQRNTDWQNDVGNTYVTTPGNANITVDTYDYFSGRLELSYGYVIDYKLNDISQYVQTETDYTYDANNYQVNKTSVRGSDGKTMNEYTTYTCDYPSTANTVLQAMLSNNIVEEPVSKYRTVLVGPSEYGLNEKVTEYAKLINGDIRPGRVLEQRFTQPAASVTQYNPDNTNNSSIYKVIQQFTYNGVGDMTGSKDEGGRSIASIYDYNDKYAVATVVNADPVVDEPAYTSFETSSFGGWTLNGSGATNYVSGGITGTAAFSLGYNGNTLSAGLNTARAYTLSLWSTAAVTVSSSAVLKKSAPTINGYTYYEYNIPQGASTVTLSGTATIDELRLYPATARMKTMTYDPLIGKTSDCDENNLAVYYEFDNLGRLRFVKDENHYTVKMYEYNNVSPAQQNGCPGSYSNHLITEMFTRSNCAAGYFPGDAPYTVPAGRYTSTISQADADAKAEYDLLVNGPSNANINGSCNLIYYNVAQSETDSTEICPAGQKGGYVTYTVPAGTYSSIISQADADQQAIDDVKGNAIAYANSVDHESCLLDNSPDWEWPDGTASYCQNGHIYQPATDVNPNSPTYNQAKNIDEGASSSCPLIYAFFDYEDDVAYPDGSEEADLSIQFSSSSTSWQPLVVYKLNVFYSMTQNCPFQETFDEQDYADGMSGIDYGNTVLAEPNNGCTFNYQLLPGNYTIGF